MEVKNIDMDHHSIEGKSLPGDKAQLQRKSSNKLKPILWTTATIAVVGITAFTLWNLKYNKYRYHDSSYGVMITDRRTEEKANTSRSSVIARITQLREAWKPWATENQGLLRRMQNSSPADFGTMTLVYDSLPANPVGPASLTNFTGLERGAVVFSWQPSGRFDSSGAIDRVYNNPDDRAKQKHILSFTEHLRRKQFAEYHDVLVSNSMGVGTSHLSLWASGRVTETKIVRHFTPGQPAFAEGPTIQILPPFDFLKNKTGEVK